MLWNESIVARSEQNNELASQHLEAAVEQLVEGLSQIQVPLADLEAAKAALVLAKIYLRQGKVMAASDVLENNVYGPVKILDRLQGNQDFSSDVYGVDLQVLVQRMALEPDQADALLQRAIGVMDQLRENVQGPDAQKKLTDLYLRISLKFECSWTYRRGNAKVALISAFRAFLSQISKTTEDEATLRWIGLTLMQLAEASMPAGDSIAKGQAAELLGTAVDTFNQMKKNNEQVPLSIQFQLARANRLLGNYKDAIKAYAALLADKPMMLDAQMEAALAYEQWAATVDKKYTAAAYATALNGGKPDAKKKKHHLGMGQGESTH